MYTEYLLCTRHFALEKDWTIVVDNTNVVINDTDVVFASTELISSWERTQSSVQFSHSVVSDSL